MAIASILIPVYNREELIERTIRCAMEQTVQDIEIIVVDNRSTDRTYEVACEMANYDKRIRIYQNDENIGPVRNWIQSVKYATSSFSKILFSDDLIAPEFLERTLPFILSPNCGFVYTTAIIGYEEWKGTTTYQVFDTDCTIKKEHYIKTSLYLWGSTPVSPGAGLFRTADLHKYIWTEIPNVSGYDFTQWGAGVDWLVYVLTALKYDNIRYIASPLAYFRAHEGSITIANENNQVAIGYQLAREWFAKAISGNT